MIDLTGVNPERPQGHLVFATTPVFPCTLGLSDFGLVRWQSNIKTVWIPAFAGKTGERRDGFPLPDRGRGQASRE